MVSILYSFVSTRWNRNHHIRTTSRSISSAPSMVLLYHHCLTATIPNTATIYTDTVNNTTTDNSLTTSFATTTSPITAITINPALLLALHLVTLSITNTTISTIRILLALWITLCTNCALLINLPFLTFIRTLDSQKHN